MLGEKWQKSVGFVLELQEFVRCAPGAQQLKLLTTNGWDVGVWSLGV
tara:strand:- start:212 stop:352 length:141 start_codon:yes stop_codon:yes gene_type:complete